MIERDSMGFTVYCDGEGCREDQTFFVYDSWQDLMREMKSSGWTKKMVDDHEWEHYCWNCSEGNDAT